MDVAQNLIFMTSYYVYFELLMISVECLFKGAFFWKTRLVGIYAKTVYCSFIPTIYVNFKSVFFYLSSTHVNLETCILVWFE